MLGRSGGSFSNGGSIPINITARRFAQRGTPSNSRRRSSVTPDMVATRSRKRSATAPLQRDPAKMPPWIPPQLTRLVTEAPDGAEWWHEIKFDGFRFHARLDHGQVRLLTRTGLDWTGKYPTIADAVSRLPAQQAYLDAELCGVRPDGTTSFSLQPLPPIAAKIAQDLRFMRTLLRRRLAASGRS